MTAAPLVEQRDIWWADLGEPVGSVTGDQRPVVVLQADGLNASRLQSYLCVPLTSKLLTGRSPWSVLLPATRTGLPKDSVALLHLVLAVDTSQLIEHVGRIGPSVLHQMFNCLDVALGRK